MARLHTSFVLGYHGCDSDVGERILAGADDLSRSERDYDWLGPGAYFWESDPRRAWEWADSRVQGKVISRAFVVGAAIDLGNCRDLLARESLELLAASYDGLKTVVAKASPDQELPRNRGKDGDKLLRYLDCAVIRFLHKALQERDEPAFDTVRGLFTEGQELYPGSGFHQKTHVQIAVCNQSAIKGLFRVPRP